MNRRNAMLLGLAGFVGGVTALHRRLDHAPTSRGGLRVGFLPVTCHLTCPVSHYIRENMAGDGEIDPVRFGGWPELKEAFLSGDLQATFILAPLAMVLREQGVPVKVVHLGHRDGTSMVVHVDSSIRRIEDLRGKTIAVPNRFSNQFLILYKAFGDRGMNIKDAKIVEMAPPDMPAALSVKVVDAVISGEPFPAKCEMDGFGRRLFLTKDVWPDFISCVLAVNENVVETRRGEVQRLVDGIARSGLWLDEDKATSLDHRHQAAEFVGRHYYNQDPKLLSYVLSQPPDRVKYVNLAVRRPDFEEIERYAKQAGIFKGNVGFQDYADTTFLADARDLAPFQWEGR